MPYEFLRSTDVYLTPLSPVHVGCGEDYEPMRYVIEKGVLYSFEPSVVRLPVNLRADLLRTAKTGRFLPQKRRSLPPGCARRFSRGSRPCRKLPCRRYGQSQAESKLYFSIDLYGNGR